MLHAFDLHVLSLPPAFVLSQDQTLKFNVLPYPLLRSGEERDPVTRLLVRLASNFELATAETFTLLKRKRPPPLAYPFPNRQCIERTTICLSILAETLGEPVTV